MTDDTPTSRHDDPPELVKMLRTERAERDHQEHVRWLVYGILTALCVIALIAGIVIGAVRANDQTQVARLRCIDAGHSWIQNQCVK